eukprot:jgi/Chrpa1/17931/Chrysochromulina_OHIO_Genome00007356-RA
MASAAMASAAMAASEVLGWRAAGAEAAWAAEAMAARAPWASASASAEDASPPCCWLTACVRTTTSITSMPVKPHATSASCVRAICSMQGEKVQSRPPGRR